LSSGSEHAFDNNGNIFILWRGIRSRAALPDPKQLLQGKGMPHVKVSSVNAYDSAALLRLIGASYKDKEARWQNDASGIVSGMKVLIE